MKTLRIGNISFEYHPETHGTNLGGTLFFIVNDKPFTWLPQSELSKLGEFIAACSKIIQDNDSNDDAKRLENSLPLVDEEWTEPKREYRKIPANYGHATCEFCPEPTDAEFIIFANGIAESEVCNKHLPTNISFYDIDEEEEDTDEFDYDGWYPEHILEVDDLEFDRIPFDGYTPETVDEDTISAEALLNNEIACPYCDGEYIITRSGNQIAATCSQCGYKELVENKPDNTSPAAIGLEPAA